ncbi:MAG: hypothetical protein ACI8V2_001384 [Candidatus Latescibacterota bacterium]|jgi:hypothetical protein
MRRWVWVLFVALCLLKGMPGVVMAESFHVIVCGRGGGEPYTERFEDWGQRLRRVLVEQMGHGHKNVRLLTESGKDADGVSSLGDIKKIFQRVGQEISKKDDVFVYLVGHGSYRRNIAKLNIVGEDLTVDHINKWIQRWSARQVVVINGASTSAVFVNALSGKGRIICTSTSSAEERNATRFMGFFIQALEEGSADQNRDERISVLEICRQAASLTEAWYTGEGYLTTEHALLDDNGDGKGTRLTEMGSVLKDGKAAEHCFLLDVRVPEGTPKALVDAYQAAIASVEALVERKTLLDSAAYYAQLETQLLKAAQLNRKIWIGQGK